MTNTYNTNELENTVEIYGLEVYAKVSNRSASLFLRTPTDQDEKFATVEYNDVPDTITVNVDALIKTADDTADYYGEFADDNDEMGEYIQSLHDAIESHNELNSIMTTAEAAKEFDLDPSTPKKAAQQGRIPARKSGDTWLIRRSDAQKMWGAPRWKVSIFTNRYTQHKKFVELNGSAPSLEDAFLQLAWYWNKLDPEIWPMVHMYERYQTWTRYQVVDKYDRHQVIGEIEQIK